MVGSSIRAGLHPEGYSVDWVRDGASAELAVAANVYDAILLDIGLPKKPASNCWPAGAAHRRRCRC